MDPKELYGRVLNMVDLVGYADDAIVSRIVMRSEKGSVTIFAFAEGQELSEHTAPFDALVQVIDGEAEINVSGELHELPCGAAMVVPAAKPHSVRAVARFKMMLTLIKG